MHPRNGGFVLNGTPFLSLFLILIPLVLASVGPSRGLPVSLARANEGPCGDGRDLLAMLLTNGKVMLNQEENSFAGLENRLQEVYSTRSDRLLFVYAEPDVPVRDVVKVLGIARRRDIATGLITRKVMGEAMLSYCGFELGAGIR